MRKILYLIFAGVLLTACQPEGRVYSEHQDLSPNVEWLRKDMRTFKVPIEDIDATYTLSLSFRYANGFSQQKAKVLIERISPSGKVARAVKELKIRDENGEYIGEAGYDIWDSEHLVEEEEKFQEKGTYTYHLSHAMDKDPLNYAMEIGLILDKK
ncbi:MAG: hypothetical protein EP338_05910 [Bacteroidetes bacterium]|nr:MAG: hypothetical protein EP338_05910 [Bacteroidota bacterium]